jgi:hypothetical protein
LSTNLDRPDPCKTLNCNDALQTIEVCEKDRRCPYAHTKRARIDRKDQARKDAARRSEG